MMTNLFSTFNPSTSFNLSFNWISAFLGIIFLPTMFWLTPSRINLLWQKIIIALHNEFFILLPKHSKGLTLIFISLFSFILFNNALSLLPYIFSCTSHMALTLTVALSLWLTFMVYGWFTNTMHMFTHLVPQGTPPILMPFMVCIETISNIIRPGTLAIRLSANMIAGYLLLTLLGNTGPSMTSLLISALLITQLLLMILESAVAIIQSYVFSILSTIYSSEVI